MKYTTLQKKFWVTLIVLFFIFSWLWFGLFENQSIESGKLIGLVISQVFSLALVNWWGIRIVRRSDYRSHRYKSRQHPFQPTSVDQWNTVERGVWGVTMLFGALSPLLGYLFSAL